MNPIVEYIDKKVQSLNKIATNVSENVDKKRRITNLGFTSAKITRYRLDPDVAKEILILKSKFPF